MARPRSQPEGAKVRTHLTAREVAGEHGDPEAIVACGIPGEYPVTEEYDYNEMDDAWKAAYDRAASMGNPVKACIVFANNQSEKYSGQTP